MDPKVAVALFCDLRLGCRHTCLISPVSSGLREDSYYVWLLSLPLAEPDFCPLPSPLSAFPLPDTIVPGLRIKDDSVAHLLQNFAFCHLNSLSWISRHSKF